MSSFEFHQAGVSLEELKESLKDYLVKSYEKISDDPQKQANDIFKYLETQVDRMIKRKSYRMQFGEDGSPMWHATIFKYLSRWISLEFSMCEMLSEELSKLED